MLKLNFFPFFKAKVVYLQWDLVRVALISVIVAFMSWGDIRRSSFGERDVGRLCSSVVRAVDRQSKDLGSNPIVVKASFFLQKDFKFFESKENCQRLFLTYINGKYVYEKNSINAFSSIKYFFLVM